MATPVPLARIAELLGVTGAADVAVSGITHDSSDVRPGDLFVALPGARHHGAQFIPAAVELGAVAVLTDPGGSESALVAGVPALVVADVRGALGEVAALVYGTPADALLVLGVTGTNGKTTTAHMIHAALTHLHRPAGLLGTIEIRVGDQAYPSLRTTPESTDLQAMLAVMGERGMESVVMEVSSIAVRMGRVDGLVLDVVGFTNLSQDHLDFHDDMDDYFAAKAALFTAAHARRGVVLVDDEHGTRLAAQAQIPVTTVSTTGRAADWQAVDIRATDDGRTTYTVVAPDGTRIDTGVGVPGRFNVDNALLAVVMLVEGGIALRDAVAGVETCVGVPGRMEPVAEGQPFVAVVDYAHTPAAVASLLRDLRTTTAGRLLVVLGCGGDRDADKRPQMGRAGAELADVLVVTDDNPRSEDAAAIRAAVVAGASQVPLDERAEVLEVAERADAIRVAVGAARAGDVVVVAGKGHEQGQEVSGVVTAFDDRDALRTAIREVMSA